MEVLKDCVDMKRAEVSDNLGKRGMSETFLEVKRNE